MDPKNDRRDRPATETHAKSQPSNAQRIGSDVGESDSTNELVDRLVETADQKSRGQTVLELGGYASSGGDGGGSIDSDKRRERYKLFYKGYRPIVKDHIPKSPARDAIWALARLLLNEGSLSQVDCRQADRATMRRLNAAVYEWLVDTNGNDVGELIKRLVDLNVDHGYEPAIALKGIEV